MTTSTSSLRYFTYPIAFTFVGLALGALLGYLDGHTASGAFAGAFSCAVLGVLEISLSLDNAIVNARILKDMPPVWRRRFLTWGILVAVFGMRIVFPVAIVAVAAHINPFEALRLAVEDPARYGGILSGAHVAISAFGGTFLLMVAFKYFFDSEKAVHWVGFLERRLGRLGDVEEIAVAVALAMVVATYYLLPAGEGGTFLLSALFGMVAFIAVKGLGNLVGSDDGTVDVVLRAGAASFLYLEVLDASFSFDGVIGAFAISKDVFIIAIGLGIGAFYVRGMTLLLVDRGTLAEYRFLEHGAFYAIFVLATIMFAQAIVDIPEVVTGLVGAAIIGAALLSSVLWTRANPEVVAEVAEADPAGEAMVGNADLSRPGA